MPISQSIVSNLQKQLQHVVAIHEADLKAKYSGTFLLYQPDRKYKNAAKEFIRQWFFPAKSLTLLSETNENKGDDPPGFVITFLDGAICCI